MVPTDVPAREPFQWEPLLSYEPFTETAKVRGFSCGMTPGCVALNNFLNTEEVEQYAEMGLGQTTLVYYQGEFVAYFTTNPEHLSIDYVKHVKSFNRYPNLKITSLPSIKIGRLAVAQPWQGKGIGETIIKHIGVEALEKHGDGVRLLILEAYRESVKFYTKHGFKLANGELRRERNRKNGTRTMFFDLHMVRGRPTDDLPQ